jgi:hypothetical protein
MVASALAMVALLGASRAAADPDPTATGGATLTAAFTTGRVVVTPGSPVPASASATIDIPTTSGIPTPLSQVSLSLPVGSAFDTSGAPGCAPAVIGAYGRGCPAGSEIASGVATLSAVIGESTIVQEAALRLFLGQPTGSVLLRLDTDTPITLGVVAQGSYSAAGELLFTLPPMPTVPGGPDFSITSLMLRTGSAARHAFVTAPSRCPSGGFSWSAHLTFVDGTAETAAATSPCPTPSGTPAGPPLTPVPPGQSPVPGTGGAVTAPPNTACISRRDFTIHIRRLQGVAYRSVAVYVDGRRVKALRGKHTTAPVDLRGLPKGRYVVRIVVTTTTGRRIVGTRAYHTCAARPRPGRPHRL